MSMKRLALALSTILLSATASFSAPPAPAVIFQDTMENGESGWSADGLWHLSRNGVDPCNLNHAGNASWYYGTSSCNYNIGWNYGSLTSQTIFLNPTTMAQLTFWYRYETETTGISWDRRYIQISVDGGAFTNLQQLSGDAMNTWFQTSIDLTAYAGHSIQIRFFFDTMDPVFNNYRGWYIDDVVVYALPSNSYVATAPLFNWTEIAATGTNTGIDCDDCSVYVPIGFNFYYFGNAYANVAVSSNGFLSFGSSASSFSNTDIPNTSVPNNYIAPFWDDLGVYASKGGGIYYQTVGTAPNRQFIVQYNNVDFWFAPDSGKLYFQVILSETDSSITFQYKDMVSVNVPQGSGSEATIGLENYSGSDGYRWSYNSASIGNGWTIKATLLDTDGDGLPDIWETTYGLDPMTAENVAADVDGDGLNWLQEFQFGTNPYAADTDGDGVGDNEEVVSGFNPVANNGIQTTRVTFAGPGVEFGTVYFKFNVTNIAGSTDGYRVYYGAASGATAAAYPAYFDMSGPAVREGYIDQKWGMQGVPVVYFRVAPINVVNGRAFVGALSNELSAYFAGSTGKASAFDESGTFIATTNQTTDNIKCFIATAAYGSPDAAPVTWLRKFRDGYLLATAPGRWLVDVYYKVSPPVADFVARHIWARTTVKVLLAPAVAASWVLVEAPLPVRVLAFFLVAGCTVVMVRIVMARRREQA